MFIFSIGLSRDNLFRYVVEKNPKYQGELAQSQLITFIAYTFLFIGVILVTSSTYKLGIIGTFQGDSFGILLPEIITGFPYNICSAPMYVGSTINFISFSILNRSIIGIVLSLIVALVYILGAHYEE